MTDPTIPRTLPATEAMATLGMPHLAYVKTVEIDGETGYAIHAADGNQMAIVDDRETRLLLRFANTTWSPMSVH